MSGIQDWILKTFKQRVVTGFEAKRDAETGKTFMAPIYNQTAVKRFSDLYAAVVQADKDYSETLGCQPSIKHTTVKPSGTVAKLAGVSEGCTSTTPAT